jgi:2'-hydroxyisoflavone reductase
MRILVLGGTAWLGHRIAQEARDRGHRVTCVARGVAVPYGVTLVRADRDRDDALAPVLGEAWDAVIDVARHPAHVRRSVRDLEAWASQYLYVSTCSVYASHARIGADEDAERLPPLTADYLAAPDDYGAAKVACEDAVTGAFGPRAAIVRAGLIGGPGDVTGRTTYWPWRFSRPAIAGRVLAPAAPELPTGMIDVRDLAQWLSVCTEENLTGVFDAHGLPMAFPDHLEVARRVAGSDAEVVYAPGDWLRARGVAEWSGPRSLPLWLSDRSWYGMNARSSARAIAAGLTRRPVEDTLRDSLHWLLRHDDRVTQGAGLLDQEERDLLGEYALLERRP